ncbi:hypothetical protein P8452_19449 [Trifolium repens]|nr:hypothetical protein P8452_19449 [Trifolium repens]
MNGSVRVISTSTIQAPSDNNNGNSNDFQKIHLTPWDLQFLPLETIQKGLLFHNPIDSSKDQLIYHLKQSLSSTLSFFPPLAGRLVITQHDEEEEEGNIASCFIICNNVGALFVHAKAENTTVSDIITPSNNYIVPSIVYSLFPLNGVKNWEATSKPILAVQVTELLDGLFIGFTINHLASDVQSTKPSNLSEGVFNFTKEKIAQLKFKANTETKNENNIKISSLQAVLAHVLRSIVRCEKLDPEQEVLYILAIGVRERMIPPLDENYFGNATIVSGFTMKAREILECGNFAKVALEMNKTISSNSNDEKIKNNYESWLRKPKLLTGCDLTRCYSLTTSSSPRFDVYGNDFGWGKPVTVRCGGANKRKGKITVFAGAEEGSIDIVPCLPYQILEAMGNDNEFMHG